MMQQFSTEMSKVQAPHPGLEALDDGFCMLDACWRVTYWNASAERMLGVSRDAILGHVLWEVLPFLRETATWESLREVQRTGVARRYLDRHPPSGSPGFASVHAAPTPDGGLAVHFRDATDEVKQAQHYSALLESIRDAFIAVDARWGIMYLNGAAEALLRLRRSEAVGVSLWSLLPQGADNIRETLLATRADGIQRHLRNVRPESRMFRGRVFDLWTYPLADGGITVLLEDVSERVQRETELSHLAALAQEANQAKSRFFAAISHELRTPLNAIVGYTHLLCSETYGAMPAGARRAADRAGVCAEHLARLVDDVLLLTTAEIGRLPLSLSKVNLGEYLPGVVEPHRHQAEAKGLSFELVVNAGVPPLETDAQRLRQLLVALLSNAVKFTSRGAVRVDVSLREGVPGEDPEGYTLFSDAQVEISVSDSGPGVALEDRERIFAPFEQTGDPARSNSMLRGTGLGLTIARQLSQLLRGQLYLADTSPSGSRFCLRLPVHHPAPGR